MKKIIPFFTLFTSMSTLICCALPALFVVLGAGATFAGLVTQVPQLIWISEHKNGVFLIAGVCLLIAGFMQRNARNLPCPIDKNEADACAKARRYSSVVHFISFSVYLVGAGFAYIPKLFSS